MKTSLLCATLVSIATFSVHAEEKKKREAVDLTLKCSAPEDVYISMKYEPYVPKTQHERDMERIAPRPAIGEARIQRKGRWSQPIFYFGEDFYQIDDDKYDWIINYRVGTVYRNKKKSDKSIAYTCEKVSAKPKW